MVIGIHVRAPEAAVFHDTVPVLPDGGGSLGHRIEPGRIGLPQQQGISKFGITVIAEYMEQVRGAHEAGLQLCTACLYHFRQLVRSGLAVGSQAEMGGQDAFCLGFVFRPGPAESDHDPSVKCLICCHIFTQGFSGFDHQLGGAGIKGGGDKGFITGSLVASGRSIQAEPVAVMGAAGPQIGSIGAGCDVIHPFVHACKLIFQ